MDLRRFSRAKEFAAYRPPHCTELAGRTIGDVTFAADLRTLMRGGDACDYDCAKLADDVYFVASRDGAWQKVVAPEEVVGETIDLGGNSVAWHFAQDIALEQPLGAAQRVCGAVFELELKADNGTLHVAVNFETMLFVGVLKCDGKSEFVGGYCRIMDYRGE